MDFLFCKLNSPLQSLLAFIYPDKKFTVILISVSLLIRTLFFHFFQENPFDIFETDYDVTLTKTAFSVV